MKNYKNFLSVVGTTLLMTTFCYGAESNPSNRDINTSNRTRRPMFPLPETKKLPAINAHSLEDWTKATTSLRGQLKTMVNHPSERALTGFHLSENIDWMIKFIENYFPNEAQSVISPLPILRKEAQNPPYSDEKIQRWFSNLDIMQEDIASRIQTALTEQQPAGNIIVPVVPQKQLSESPTLLISKEVAAPQKHTEESLSQKIYTSEIEVISIITSILRAILNNEETSSLRRSLQEIRTSIMQSLKIQKKALENASQYQLVTKEIDKINLKITISQTLNYFYVIKIQKANGNEKAIVENASNFVNHFIEMAALIEKTVFDKYDRKLIEYLINNSFFIKYFAYEEEITTLVPEEKREEFYKAYTKIIRNILKRPAVVVTAPENPVEQPKKQHPPVAPTELVVEPQPVQPINVPVIVKPAAQPAPISIMAQQHPTPMPEPKAKPNAPEPTPSFWSSIAISVSDFVSNAWEGIKDFFGRIKSGITSRLFPKPTVKTEEEIRLERARAEEQAARLENQKNNILEAQRQAQLDAEKDMPIAKEEAVSIGNQVVQIVKNFYKTSNQQNAKDEIDALAQLYLAKNQTIRSQLSRIWSAINANNNDDALFQLSNFLGLLNNKHNAKFNPEDIKKLRAGELPTNTIEQQQDTTQQQS